MPHHYYARNAIAGKDDFMCEIYRDDNEFAGALYWGASHGVLLEVNGRLPPHEGAGAWYATGRFWKALKRACGNDMTGQNMLRMFCYMGRGSTHKGEPRPPVPLAPVRYGAGIPRNGRGAYARGT